jgi:hypothetical protein
VPLETDIPMKKADAHYASSDIVFVAVRVIGKSYRWEEKDC